MEKEYNRKKAIDYAYKWALDRNPKYYNYDNLGGDCTNFVSQCIFEGSKIMNYSKNFGWYYINANNKSPSWTGVEFLYNYLTRNSTLGPIGIKTSKNNVEEGDIIQLSFDNRIFSHSLFITKIVGESIYVATHTDDNLNKALNLYNYKDIRFIHIEKVLV